MREAEGWNDSGAEEKQIIFGMYIHRDKEFQYHL
jgi:hypothetical protein